LAPLRAVYGQIPFLRYALSLPPRSLVPWDVWVARSHLAISDEYEIYWCVFDEIIEYLRPIVEETLDAAAKHLTAKLPERGWESVANWAERRMKRNWSYRYRVSFLPDKQFWEQFDKYLYSVGVRKFSAADLYEKKARKS